MTEPPTKPSDAEHLLDDMIRQLRDAGACLARRVDALPPDLDDVPPVVVDEEAPHS